MATAGFDGMRSGPGGSAGNRVLRRIVHALRRLGAAAIRRRRLARDGRILMVMGERDLRDLGIRRDDIRHVVRY